MENQELDTVWLGLEFHVDVLTASEEWRSGDDLFKVHQSVSWLSWDDMFCSENLRGKTSRDGWRQANDHEEYRIEYVALLHCVVYRHSWGTIMDRTRMNFLQDASLHSPSLQVVQDSQRVDHHLSSLDKGDNSSTPPFWFSFSGPSCLSWAQIAPLLVQVTVLIHQQSPMAVSFLLVIYVSVVVRGYPVEDRTSMRESVSKTTSQ